MIDKAKLEALDMVTLSQLRDAINEVLHAKMRTAAYIGFDVLVQGGVRMHVTSYRQKNLSGYIVGDDGTKFYNRKYRAHPLLASVVPEVTSKPIKLGRPLRTAQDTPGSVPASAF